MHKNKDFGFIPLSDSKGLQFSDLTCNTTLCTEQTRDEHIPKYYTPLDIFIYTHIYSLVLLWKLRHCYTALQRVTSLVCGHVSILKKYILTFQLHDHNKKNLL